MQLFGSFTSPFVRHVRIVLRETEIACDFVQTDAAGSAAQSPTMKVPFLKANNTLLTDSTSIIRYLREKAGQTFLASLEATETYCLVNTLMDSAINLFLLENNGIDTSTNPYFDRQRDRITAGLKYLESQVNKGIKKEGDDYWRLMCFLAWGRYRERFPLAPYPALLQLLQQGENHPHLIATAPPASH